LAATTRIGSPSRPVEEAAQGAGSKAQASVPGEAPLIRVVDALSLSHDVVAQRRRDQDHPVDVLQLRGGGERGACTETGSGQDHPLDARPFQAPDGSPNVLQERPIEPELVDGSRAVAYAVVVEAEPRVPERRELTAEPDREAVPVDAQPRASSGEDDQPRLGASLAREREDAEQRVLAGLEEARDLQVGGLQRGFGHPLPPCRL
jgi:hypothetical protein